MRLLIAILAAGLALPASAAAANGTWDLSEDGQPRIDRSVSSPPPDLFVCPPGGACARVDAPVIYEPGETAAGTVFEARGADGSVDRSPVWQGAVGPESPPAVAGDAVEGAVVQPVAGDWSGGWADDLSALSLHLCRTQDGEECRALPLAGATGAVPVSGAGPASLVAGSAGGYLFAADVRVAGDRRAVPAPLPYRPNMPLDLPLPGARTVISLPLGPVAPAGGTPPPALTGRRAPAAKPSLKLRKRAYRRRGRVVLGTVTCPVRCRVQLRVGNVRRDFRMRGTRRLEIVRGKRVRAGRPKVTVRIDGARVASARVRVRR